MKIRNLREPSEVTALVLSGGGARAAYQVGVLKAIAELFPQRECHFSIITGVSAGSINGTHLACRANQFGAAVNELWDLWGCLSPEKVFRTDTIHLAGIGLRWLLGLLFSGIMGRHKPNFLLDTSPLRTLLHSKLNFQAMRGHIQSGLLKGVAVSVTSYQMGNTITFFEGTTTKEPVPKRQHSMVRTRLTSDHVLASGAIPLFFPPVRIGNTYFGDGGIHFMTPLSPAIHLGARRILAIGIKHWEPTVPSISTIHHRSIAPSLADLAGILLNAIFLNTLDVDIERLQRINQNLNLLVEANLKPPPLYPKHIPIFLIQPSVDLGGLAFQIYKSFPPPLKYLLQGLGADSRKGWDFLSYLSFDRTYTFKLLELGYRDAMTVANDLRDFFNGRVPRWHVA